MRALCLITLAALPNPLLHAHEADETPRDANSVYEPLVVPDRIVLSWTGDPATTQAVTWRTAALGRDAVAEIAVAGDGPKFVANAEQVEATTQTLDADLGKAEYHTAHFSKLKPSTKYAYRVGYGGHWSEWAQFTTASDKPEPLQFIYFGDAQNDIKSHWSRVVREAHADAPRADFFLHAGDLVNRANSDVEWGEWFYAGSHVHRMIPALATPGNHEYSAGRLSKHWRPTFALPTNGPEGLEETCYYVDVQGVRLISLDSNRDHEKQAEWLRNVLEENEQPWTIVTYHHPMYSSGNGRDNPHLRKLWQPLFDEFGVDLALQGHDHTYARTGLVTTADNVPGGARVRDEQGGGTVYVVSVSGPKMYKLQQRDIVKRSAENTQLYQIITVDGDELRYEARTATAKPYDAFTLKKRAGQPNELVEQIPE